MNNLLELNLADIPVDSEEAGISNEGVSPLLSSLQSLVRLDVTHSRCDVLQLRGTFDKLTIYDDRSQRFNTQHDYSYCEVKKKLKNKWR